MKKRQTLFSSCCEFFFRLLVCRSKQKAETSKSFNGMCYYFVTVCFLRAPAMFSLALFTTNCFMFVLFQQFFLVFNGRASYTENAKYDMIIFFAESHRVSVPISMLGIVSLLFFNLLSPPFIFCPKKKQPTRFLFIDWKIQENHTQNEIWFSFWNNTLQLINSFQ